MPLLFFAFQTFVIMGESKLFFGGIVMLYDNMSEVVKCLCMTADAVSELYKFALAHCGELSEEEAKCVELVHLDTRRYLRHMMEHIRLAVPGLDVLEES